MLNKLKKYKFLFEELVKRDFLKKYKRTVLGIAWSMISPLMNLLILWLVFSHFFGNNVDHYVIYLFAGQLVFSYFTDATNFGMTALVANAHIFSKINVPKYMFLLSQQLSALINFLLTLVIFFVFCLIDKITFSFNFLLLIYPVICLVIFNLGIGLILSALYVFFKDTQYFWGICTQLIMWCSATFYNIDGYSDKIKTLFMCNPIYVYIKYFRMIVLDGSIPSVSMHILMLVYSLLALAVGSFIYKKYNHEFLYYV